MKKVSKHIIILLISFLAYFIITSINDVYSPNWSRWGRGWEVNAIEITMSIITTYGCVFIAEWWERKKRSSAIRFTPWVLFKELLSVFLTVFLWVNLFGGPIMEAIDNYDLHDFIVVNVISGLFTLNYYFILRGNFYIRQYIDHKLLLEKLEKDKINEELKYLKNQIHPHFLFNALNTIYFQMDESVANAKLSVEKFSNLLRYRLYDNREEKTSLQKELDFISDYISFEKLRHSEDLKLKVTLPENVADIKTYPFLFMPFLENAFKFLGGEKMIELNITLTNSQLRMEVKNSMGAGMPGETKKGGIGLTNLKRRLELLYPGKHELVHGQQGDYYIGSLTIDLHED